MNRIVDNIQDLDVETIETDVCVIGSGPAGGIVAANLAKKNVRVSLLEAGGELPDYSCESIDTSNLVLDEAALRFGWSLQFGGSSNLWAGRTCPLEDIDFEKRSWIPDSGWPFKAETLVTFYKRAAEILRIPGFQYFSDYHEHEEEQNVFKSALDVNIGFQAKFFQWAKNPFIVSDYLKDVAKDHPSLRIFLRAPVSRLQEKPDGSAIEFVQVTTENGGSLIVKARLFVLAAGGIETPRLLLNSNRVRSTGIGNDYDVVGRYFSTHPKADMAAIILNKAVSTSHAFFMDRSLGAGSFRYGIGFSKEMQKRLKLLNHYVQLSPLLEYQANHAFEVIKKTKVLSNELIDRNNLIQGFLPGLGKLAYESIGRVAKFQPRARKFILRGFLDQYPDRENRITLSSNKKKDGTCKADIRWRYSDRDKQSVLKFFSHLDLVLHQNNIGRVEFAGLEKLENWPLVYIHSHFMGATRMGDDKKTSVVDTNARVHDVSNLYVAGPSLFPTYGFANPFLTITALSLKLADHLLTQVKKC